MSIIKPAKTGQLRSERLRDIIDAIRELSDEAYRMLDNKWHRQRAEAYWKAHVSLAVDEPVVPGEETLYSMLERLEDEEAPVCADCGHEMTQDDVDEYRAVVGDEDAVPGICKECAPDDELPACARCTRSISRYDLAQFRIDAGDPHAVPRTCSTCADIEAAPFRGERS